ncbi:cytochrome d ubiquinol oxidase subunit II [Cuniculiplasma divulgatum]|jgi:cytochrome bd-type quinol oxidase subunit 2|uniref:Cytochrome d ubiquinol oxidase subunit II n=2 Tax=Cuniculiplasma divulgatum TaxID=1673428 RepID=A0A1N5TEZ7_9ARCH|nr:MAG: hypothetical protein AMDU5_GPLC00010G0110 [Thermoplasmatales archaeon Gpl]SIM46992.1 cytochrome d ubiquinol oxidase subunit II [Cuniculiplasma divulgatum]
MTGSVNVEVIVNILVFSIFFTSASTELMAASAILFKYKESQTKVFGFLLPIWEITGTLFVFYVVNLEGLVPDVLPLLAFSFISYILIFLILYVLRNSIIIFAEMIWKNRVINKKTLYSIYALVTFVLGAMILLIYASFIGGHGINYTARTFNLLNFITFLPDDGFIIGIAILLFGMASIFYDLKVNRFLPLLVIVVGLIISGVALRGLGDYSNSTLPVVSLILFLLIPILWILKPTRKYITNKLVFQGIFAISIFIVAFSQYPYLLGRTLNITTILNNTAMQTEMFYATIVGGIILFVLTFFFYDIYFEKGKQKEMDQQKNAGS